MYNQLSVSSTQEITTVELGSQRGSRMATWAEGIIPPLQKLRHLQELLPGISPWCYYLRTGAALTNVWPAIP